MLNNEHPMDDYRACAKVRFNMGSNHLPSEIAVRFNVAYRGHYEQVIIPNTQFCIALVQLLYTQGLIGSFAIQSDSGIAVRLKYVHTHPL